MSEEAPIFFLLFITKLLFEVFGERSIKSRRRQPNQVILTKCKKRQVNRSLSCIWKDDNRRLQSFGAMYSHNANLVVNGDSELVVSCGYRVAGEQAGGEIKCQGAIDLEDVRTEITKVMEGGRAAFLLRKDKYGF